MVGVNGELARSRSEAPRGGRSWLTAANIARVCGGTVLRRGRAARSVVTDSRLDCAEDCFIALQGPNHDGHEHALAAVAKGARGIVVARQEPALEQLIGSGAYAVRVPDTGQALMQMAKEHRRRLGVRVVGITGSCGKTTTKEWLGQVLAAAIPTVRSPGSYNNQVGVPLTLFRMSAETAAAVVEIGTNAPGEVAALAAVAQPDIGIVTCVAAAHLKGLGSLDGVASEKAALVASLPRDGLCVLNGDDVACRAMAERTKARVAMVAIDRPADWFATDVHFHGLGTSFLLQGERPVTLPRLGTHNVYNALFTIAAATELGLPLDDVLHVLGQVPNAERRLELKQVGDVQVIDDTYNMNPASARAALRALAGLPHSGRRIVVFGEMLELGERSVELHRELGAEVKRTGMDLLLCVGTGAAPIAEGARAEGMAGRVVLTAADLAEARELLLELLRPGDQILCKASRRAALDRLVDGLITHLQSACAEGGGS